MKPIPTISAPYDFRTVSETVSAATSSEPDVPLPLARNQKLETGISKVLVHREKIKPYVGSGIGLCNRITVVIIVLYLIALYIMVRLTDNCYGDIPNHGLKCLGKIQEEKRPNLPWGNFCQDINNKTCHYIDNMEQVHVHVQGVMLLCGSRYSDTRVGDLQLWDHDSFLHFGDDRLVECTLESDTFFNCHHRGAYLIEGWSRADPPDLYFTMHVKHERVCVTSPECRISTRDMGTVVPAHTHPANCRFLPGSSRDVITVVRDEELLSQLQPESPYFHETSQLDNWIVWKCWVEIHIDKLRNYACT